MRASKSSSISSAWCLLLLHLWVAFPMAFGLVSDEIGFVVGMPSTTTPGPNLTTEAFNSSTNASFAAHFGPTLGCGNKKAHCHFFCDYCDVFGQPRMDCYTSLFKMMCYGNFHNGMAEINSTDWCMWSKVRSLYNNFTLCTEETAECLLIPWPNPVVEETFVEIHTEYFLDCPSEELTDPPPGVVFALVMTPICLIPVMVVLVVLKTKNGDGSS